VTRPIPPSLALVVAEFELAGADVVSGPSTKTRVRPGAQKKTRTSPKRSGTQRARGPRQAS
jgi:hypothetical protein